MASVTLNCLNKLIKSLKYDQTCTEIQDKNSLFLSERVHLSRSVAVRMEDYEVYYKKQKADSNCGFAEEFEVKNKLNILELQFIN